MKLLEKISQENLGYVAIFTGAGVDPDGMASGMAMAMLIEELGGKSTIFYNGAFNRPQNKTMREILSLTLFPAKEAIEKEFTLVISVDGPADVCPIPVDYVIDHHKPGSPPKVNSDIREIGSASAILWEYTKEKIDYESEQGKLLATALAVGILTDTNNYKEEATSNLDFEAAAFCLKYKDHKKFLSILNWPKPPYYNDMYAEGWLNKITEGTVLITGLGSIPSGRAGIISDLAEKFLETNGVSTTVVVAMVDSKIMLSVRSCNTSLDVNDFVKTVFGDGGGKRGAGAAQIPLPQPLSENISDEDKTSIFNSFFSVISSKALEFAGDGARDVEKE